ncbi:MAG: hypothetical protein NTW87_18520 [Planctomycetota bacterium]|nr:hypothetical protein [Planctomycetota bacterium]
MHCRQPQDCPWRVCGLAALVLWAPCCAAVRSEDARPTGPRVEIAPRDARPPYSCFLLGFTGSVLELRLQNGEMRQERAADVKSVRFLRPPPPPPPLPPIGTVKRPGRNDGDGHRHRELVERDIAGQLTPAETEELLRLKEHMPLAHSDVLPRRRIEIAMRNFQFESSKGRLEQYIAMMQRRLKSSPTEDDARDALWTLATIYTQKSPAAKVRDMLVADADSITNQEIAKKMRAEVPAIVGMLALGRAWRR